jgi:hypothetical protein
MHKQEVLFPARPRILFIVLPPHSLLSLSVTGILVAEGLLVHIEARVDALCFVSG